MANENQDPNKDHKTEDKGTGSAFTADYVRELREEAASWRTKFRETEGKVTDLSNKLEAITTSAKVTEELAKRGLKINPKFITLGEDKDPVKAVDSFLEEYPQFGSEAFSPEPRRKEVGKPNPASKDNSNKPSARRGNIMDAAKDPIARAKLRDQYRSMLGRGDN